MVLDLLCYGRNGIHSNSRFETYEKKFDKTEKRPTLMRVVIHHSDQACKVSGLLQVE